MSPSPYFYDSCAKFGLIAMLWAASYSVWAQSDSIVLHEVQVIEHVTPAKPIHAGPVLTVQSRNLAPSISESLASILSSYPGMSVQSSGTNGEIPMIHGLSGNRIAILNDGIKHSFQNWGLDHAPEIDYSNAHSIRVVKGAGGVKYGPEAMGGIVLVQSKPLLLNRPLFGHVELGGSSNGWGYFNALELGRGGNKWSAYTRFKKGQRGDQRAPSYYLTNTGKQETSWNTGLRFYAGGAWDFQANYKYIEQNLGFLRAAVFESINGLLTALQSDQPLISEPFQYKIQNPRQITSHHAAQSVITWRPRLLHKVIFNTNYQNNRRQEMDVRRNSEKPIIDLTLRSIRFNTQWEIDQRNRGKMEVGAGIAQFDNDNNPGTGTTAYIPNYNTTQTHIYTLKERTLGLGFIDLGLRMDVEQNRVRGREINQQIFRDTYAFVNMSVSAGYSRKILNNSTPWSIHFGSAWRAPNMAELYSFGQHSFKSVYGLLRRRWNDDETLATDQVELLESSGVRMEYGYKVIQEFLFPLSQGGVNIQLYSHYIENYIFQKPAGFTGSVRGPLPVFIYAQTNAFLSGVDASWENNIRPGVSSRLSASYVHAVNLQTGGPLLHQPPLKMQWDLEWKPELRQLAFIKLSPKYIFQPFFAPGAVNLEQWLEEPESLNLRTEIYDFQSPSSGYFLLDLTSELTLKRFVLRMSIRNLLNASYRNYLNEMRYFANEPGLDIAISLRYNFTLNQS